MSSQRYERVSNNEEDDSPVTPQTAHTPDSFPISPPPSFRSRTSSPTSRRLLTSQDPLASDADRTLADTFDDGEGSDDEGEDGGDDRQRLMRGTATQQNNDERTAQEGNRPAIVQRRVTELPVFLPRTVPATGNPRRVYGGGSASVNDGVFANLNAKPEKGEKTEEEKPPTYEQAAADATPPYWETTILAPGMISDEVFVDGLPVGSAFSFVWNGMISMSFQLVGFLLTYLLHTTHAAKNGSRAGLGITLVQYGFYMKGSGSGKVVDSQPQYSQPPDPNSHDFNPSTVSDGAASAAVASMADSPAGGNAGTGLSSVASSEWLAYILMIAGWFILIRAVSDFLKARRHEQLVLQSPDRGLSVPVIAEGERSENVV
ncbi:MAG: hypothetical protein M1830_003997 [Pleopsidium flavum]|nr:MAG: hypothetical protein M1830_003997 [Pleopsidium flavum]